MEIASSRKTKKRTVTGYSYNTYSAIDPFSGGRKLEAEIVTETVTVNRIQI